MKSRSSRLKARPGHKILARKLGDVYAHLPPAILSTDIKGKLAFWCCSPRVFGDEAGKRNLKKQKNQTGPFRVSPWKRSNSNSIFLEFEFQTRFFLRILLGYLMRSKTLRYDRRSQLAKTHGKSSALRKMRGHHRRKLYGQLYGSYMEQVGRVRGEKRRRTKIRIPIGWQEGDPEIADQRAVFQGSLTPAYPF